MPNKYLKWTTAAALVLALMLIGFLYNKYRVAPRISFAGLQVIDTQGARVTLQPRAGRSLIVVFYASWCHDCARELPRLKAKWMQNPEKADVAAVTDEGIESMVDYRTQHGYPFAFYTLTQPFDAYGIEAIPTVYILNDQGKITFSKVGEVDWGLVDIR